MKTLPTARQKARILRALCEKPKIAEINQPHEAFCQAPPTIEAAIKIGSSFRHTGTGLY
jgi:hypothetical protein